jgi:hypothetical protein
MPGFDLTSLANDTNTVAQTRCEVVRFKVLLIPLFPPPCRLYEKLGAIKNPYTFKMEL